MTGQGLDSRDKPQCVADRYAARRIGGSLLQQGSPDAAPRRGRDLPRRRHSRDHQGPAAIGRRVCRRLPGRAGVAPARRAGPVEGLPGRARRAGRSLRERGVGGGDAGRLDPLSAPRRGDVEVDRRHQCRRRRAVQSRVARRDRRRADRHRRGLRRGRQRGPGAHARLRAQVVAAALRSAARPRAHGADGRAGVRAVRGGRHAGDVSAAHSRLPRARQLRLQGQRRAARSPAGTCSMRRRRSTTTGCRIRRRRSGRKR